MARRPFADGAGYMRHCWERAAGIGTHVALCERTGMYACKHDSPHNPQTPTGDECEYERW